MFVYDSSNGLDGKRAEVSHRDGVHAQTVAAIVELSELLNGTYLAQPAKGVNGFVLRPFDGQHGASVITAG